MQQLDAINILKLGFNVFLTGAAGAGKTYVLNQYIKHLNEHKIGVGITASTGIAATHMQGMTIHSWAGIGVHDDIDDAGLSRLLEKSQLVKRFNETKVLIIDEVSMLHGARLDLIDKVCRTFKDETKPFGGLQVILSGDLFQLPPVTKAGDVDWMFLSRAWKEMNLKICYLKEQHRQDDSDLLDILNAMRDDQIEEYHQELLGERLQARPRDDQLPLTKLYTHNADVDSLNSQALAAIDGAAKTFAMESIKGSKKLVESLMNSCLAPQVLELKIGAEVMFVVNNIKEGYVNGTRGRVVAFTDENLPVVVTADEKTFVAKKFSWKVMDGETTRAEISQVPLRLAWAITVHKSQGMSLNAAQIDLSKAFEPGMGYVAISRVRSLDGLFLNGANSNALQVHPDIRKLDSILQNKSVQLVKALDDFDSGKLETSHKQVRTALAPEKEAELDYDKVFYEKLRNWRTKEAKDKSLPPYVVFDDKTLKLFAAHFPENENQLLKLKGVGPKKLEQYGNEIITMVQQHKK